MESAIEMLQSQILSALAQRSWLEDVGYMWYVLNILGYIAVGE